MCAPAAVTTVPLPTNIQAEDIVKIINEAELTCLICSLGELPNLAPLVGGCETVKNFIVMDLPEHTDPETEALLKKVGIIQVLMYTSQAFQAKGDGCVQSSTAL